MTNIFSYEELFLLQLIEVFRVVIIILREGLLSGIVGFFMGFLYPMMGAVELFAPLRYSLGIFDTFKLLISWCPTT